MWKNETELLVGDDRRNLITQYTVHSDRLNLFSLLWMSKNEFKLNFPVIFFEKLYNLSKNLWKIRYG